MARRMRRSVRWKSAIMTAAESALQGPNRQLHVGRPGLDQVQQDALLPAQTHVIDQVENSHALAVASSSTRCPASA